VSQPIRVVIADDQQLVRTGFRLILDAEDDLDVVAEAGDGLEAVKVVRRERPDVVLMDIRMPELNGIEATRRIIDAGIRTRVLMLTTFDLNEYVYEALRAGASGFLLKDTPAEQLAEGVRVVARGDALLAPSVTRRLLDEFARPPTETPATRPAPAGLDELTARELEVFRLIARGKSNAEIAADLFVSETTVKTHVARVLMKLGVRDRVQAVVLAYESGVVDPGGA
jgi:DNA-binding NarL/FixJ family response regulator